MPKALLCIRIYSYITSTALPLAKLIGLTYITTNTAGPSALVHGSAFLYLPLVQPYTKPFLPVADQIARIQARGMVVTDKGKAQQYLENIGYYRLSGYWYPLRRSQITTAPSGEIVTTVLDDFRSGSEFSQVVDLYVFDKKLRLMMLDVLERIEIAFRTDIALQLGQYDPWAYREPTLLDGKFTADIPKGRSKTRFWDFIDRFDRAVSDSKEDFVKHFRATYSNPLPIWAAVELWDFGTLSMFLSGMKYRDQRAIAARYGVPRPELLPTWVRTLAFVRNVCAHHSRMWNKPLVAEPRAPRVGEVPLLDHLAQDKFARERFYSAAALARYFQRQINPNSSWGTRFVAAVDTFPQAPGIALGQAGSPADWKTLPLWS